MNKNIKSFLKAIPLFSSLSNKELNEVLKYARKEKYKKYQILFEENDKGDEMYIILSGIVKIFKTDNLTKRTKTISYLREGDFFGEMALLDVETRSASAQVIEDAEILILNGVHFQKFILQNPKVSLKIMKTLSSRLRYLTEQIKNVVFYNLPGRVASCLIDLSQKYGKNLHQGRTITISLTHQELADLVGTARESITSILNLFQKTGCIKINKRQITILDESKLSSWIS
jgi:CRP/FNR family transcriptional regulator